jgi:hypothetical protein
MDALSTLDVNIITPPIADTFQIKLILEKLLGGVVI